MLSYCFNRQIVVLGGQCTPFGRVGGQYKEVPAPLLGAAAMRGALNVTGLAEENVGGVWMGCVVMAGMGQNPARQAAILGSLPPTTPCTTVNKVCGSSMVSMIDAAHILLTGSCKEKVALVGGMENLSRAPYWTERAVGVAGPMTEGGMKDSMVTDGLQDPLENGELMGKIADRAAQDYGLSRRHIDQHATLWAERALKSSAHRDVLTRGVRQDTRLEQHLDVHTWCEEPIKRVCPAKLEKLSPSFDPKGVLTAGSSSQLADGAAALVLGTQEMATQGGGVWFQGYANVAQEPRLFTFTPVMAIKRLLETLKWRVQDVDLWEINEAFTTVPMIVMKEFDLPVEKINITGGAASWGHPLGATGAWITLALIENLRQRGGGRGVAALCVGGGEAIALALEVEG